MIRKLSLSISVIFILNLDAACSSSSAPDAGTSGGASDSNTTATPAPAVGSTVTAASTPEAAAASLAGSSTPEPTVAAAMESEAEDEIKAASKAFDVDQLMAEAPSSPQMLSYLTSQTDMSDLLELAQREPTDQEISLLLPCLTGDEEEEEDASANGTPTATPAPADQTILAHALASPGLMWCLAGGVGMGTMIELDNRAPTSQERSDIDRCLSDTREIAAWNAEWPKRLDAAFTPSTCGPAPVNNFPSSYYQGPLIEAHPDRFRWGTDRGDIVWGYDEDVGQILAEFGRAFIGRFDPEIQEDLDYKNVERLIALTTK